MAALLLMLIGIVIFSLLPRKPKPWLPRIRSKPLLTPNETEFFHRLQRALPAYHVFPRCRLQPC
jgi:hypothetical protein